MRKFNKTFVRVIIAIVAVSALLHMSFVIASGVMTNTDVINLVNAKMSSDIIVSAIRGADETAFDTSPNELIALKNAGVSDAVIQAMIAPRPAQSTPTQPFPTPSFPNYMPKPAFAPGEMNPEEIIAIDDGVETPLRSESIAPRMKMFRPNIFYFFRGHTATLRLSRQPSFMVAVPNNVPVANYVVWVKLTQKKGDGTREIKAKRPKVFGSGGLRVGAAGFSKKQVVAVTANLATDQSKVPEGFMKYMITPSKPFKKGEYAAVISTTLARQDLGVFAGNPGGGYAFFPFGVD